MTDSVPRELSLALLAAAAMVALWVGLYLTPLLRKRKSLATADDRDQRRYRSQLTSTVVFGVLVIGFAFAMVVLTLRFIWTG